MKKIAIAALSVWAMISIIALMLECENDLELFMIIKAAAIISIYGCYKTAQRLEAKGWINTKINDKPF